MWRYWGCEGSPIILLIYAQQKKYASTSLVLVTSPAALLGNSLFTGGGRVRLILSIFNRTTIYSQVCQPKLTRNQSSSSSLLMRSLPSGTLAGTGIVEENVTYTFYSDYADEILGSAKYVRV